MGERVLEGRNFVTLIMLIFLAACGQNTDHQRFFKASESVKNPGLIVSGLTKEQRDQLLLSNPESKYRVLNPNLSIFEITGVSESAILEVSKDVIIEANEVVNFNSKNHQLKLDTLNQITGLNNKSPRDFFKDCTQSTFLSVPEAIIQPLEVQSSDYLQANDSIRVETPEVSAGDKTAWFVIPPLGSNQEVKYSEEKTLDITFSMAGTYRVAHLYKRNDVCNFEMFTLSPTSNEPLTSIIETPNRSMESFYHLDLINHEDALSILNPIQEVIVAVCDSGVNYNHPTLRESIWTNNEEVMDGIDNDGNGYIDDLYGYDFYYNDSMPMDDDGHGTHVAGLISGYEMGVANGIAKIMPLKAGTSKGYDVGSIIECISYATQKEADIINLSLGGNGANRIIELVIEKANEKGILIVAAAGNGDARGQGVNNDITPVFPASYQSTNIFAVASVEENGSLTSYSNFGENSVDIAAPGGYETNDTPTERQLLSAYIPNPEGVYLQPLSGTSMAAPVVAGAAAMMLSEFPETLPEQTIGYFKNSGAFSNSLVGKLNSASILDIHGAISSRKLLF